MGFFEKLFGKLEKKLEPPSRSLDELKNLIEQFNRPTVLLAKTGVDTTSYLGGLPMMPGDFDWPRKDGKRVAPIDFQSGLRKQQDAMPIMFCFPPGKHCGKASCPSGIPPWRDKAIAATPSIFYLLDPKQPAVWGAGC